MRASWKGRGLNFAKFGQNIEQSSNRKKLTLVFTALHGMQTRCCDENSVRPSVRLSVKRVNWNKMAESYVQIFISYERTFILVFW